MADRLEDPAIEPELRATLRAALPVFHRHFWPEQDRVNRAWAAAIAERVRAIAPDVIPRLEKVYATMWFTAPVRADVVWVGSWAGAYTTINPSHVTLSSTDPSDQEWSGAEFVFHELSHLLSRTLWNKLETGLGAAEPKNSDLWHAVLFFVTGTVVHDVLATRAIDYTPAVYALGLFERVWSRYQRAIEDAWTPYVAGQRSMDDAIARNVAAIVGP
jgi:hypothetical protein